MLAALAGCGGAGRSEQSPGAPAPGTAPGSVAPAGEVPARCRGAAAAAAPRACAAAGRLPAVSPDPLARPGRPGRPHCSAVEDRGLLHVCFWGVPAARARRTVALIGDSHASVWHPALLAVVRARRWRAVSISRAGCPLTHARPRLPGARRVRACMSWNRQVQAWIARHRAISVVFLAAHRGRVVPRGRSSMRAAQRAGYAAALRALLRSGVGDVVVLRDTPRLARGTLRCVALAASRGRSPGAACAVPRRYALRSDPLAEAAVAMRSRRVRVIDLTRLMCGPRSCPPVIGGLLVLRDRQHMSDQFSATLGPFLLRAVDRVARSW